MKVLKRQVRKGTLTLVIKTSLGHEKEYVIDENYFSAHNRTTNESYDLGEIDYQTLKNDGLIVMSMYEELMELENINVAIAIMSLYLRNFSMNDVLKVIIVHLLDEKGGAVQNENI